MNFHSEIMYRCLTGERLNWDLLSKVPRFEKLIHNKENALWHREGTTQKHLELMFDILHNDLESAVSNKYFGILNLSILLHDAWKVETNAMGKDGHIHNYGHEQLAARYMWDFFREAELRNRDELYACMLTCNLVIWHMNKDVDFFLSKRAKYCLSAFSEEGCRLLSTFHMIDQNGAISDHRYPESTLDVILSEKAKIINYKPTAPNTLFMMVGPSGSGKSTFSGEMLGDTVELVSTDELRANLLGDIANQDNNEKIFAEARKLVNNHLVAGKDVVLDATNIKIKSRKMFVEQAQRLGVNIVCHVFMKTLNECLEGQKQRTRQVPPEIVKRQYEQMELPSPVEASEIIYHF